MSLLVYRVVTGCISLSKKRKAKHANPRSSDTALSTDSAVVPTSQSAGTPVGEPQPTKHSHAHNAVPIRTSALHRSSSYWDWIEKPEPDFGCLVERVGRTPSNKHYLEQVSRPTRRVRYKIHKDGRRERDDSMLHTSPQPTRICSTHASLTAFPYESVFTPLQIRPGPKLPWSVKHRKLSSNLPGRKNKPFLERQYLKREA